MAGMFSQSPPGKRFSAGGRLANDARNISSSGSVLKLTASGSATGVVNGLTVLSHTSRFQRAMETPRCRRSIGFSRVAGGQQLIGALQLGARRGQRRRGGGKLCLTDEPAIDRLDLRQLCHGHFALQARRLRRDSAARRDIELATSGSGVINTSAVKSKSSIAMDVPPDTRRWRNGFNPTGESS